MQKKDWASTDDLWMQSRIIFRVLFTYYVTFVYLLKIHSYFESLVCYILHFVFFVRADLSYQAVASIHKKIRAEATYFPISRGRALSFCQFLLTKKGVYFNKNTQKRYFPKFRAGPTPINIPQMIHLVPSIVFYYGYICRNLLATKIVLSGLKKQGEDSKHITKVKKKKRRSSITLMEPV